MVVVLMYGCWAGVDEEKKGDMKSDIRRLYTWASTEVGVCILDGAMARNAPVPANTRDYPSARLTPHLFPHPVSLHTPHSPG